MKKRIVFTLLVAIVMACLLSIGVYGADIIDSGKCGDNLTWTLHDDGELVIEGTGDMWDYGLKYVNGNGLTTAPWGEYSDKFTKLTLKEGVTSIGWYAFKGCSGFTGELVIPDSVTSIGVCAFYDCSGFTGDLVIGNSVTTINNLAFYNCSGFTGDLVIPDSVTSIGNQAFDYCNGFTGNLVIGNGVSAIGYSAFFGCNGFVEIIVEESNENYHSDGNCLINSSTNELLKGCNYSVIPNCIARFLAYSNDFKNEFVFEALI